MSPMDPAAAQWSRSSDIPPSGSGNLGNMQSAQQSWANAHTAPNPVNAAANMAIPQPNPPPYSATPQNHQPPQQPGFNPAGAAPSPLGHPSANFAGNAPQATGSQRPPNVAPQIESWPVNGMPQFPLPIPPPNGAHSGVAMPQPSASSNGVNPGSGGFASIPPIPIPPLIMNNPQADHRGSLAPLSPFSPPPGGPFGPPPLNARGAVGQQQIAQLPEATAQTVNVAAVMDQMGNLTLGQANPPLIHHAPNGPQSQARFINPLAQQAPDPEIQQLVSQRLQNFLAQGFNIPLYPAPTDIASNAIPPGEDIVYRSALADVANRLHNWTRRFDGNPTKQLTQTDANQIKGCLDIFSLLDSALVTAIDSNRIRIADLFYSSSRRCSVVSYITALAIHVFVFFPFYPGVEMNLGQALHGLTEDLFRNRIFPCSQNSLTL